VTLKQLRIKESRIRIYAESLQRQIIDLPPVKTEGDRKHRGQLRRRLFQVANNLDVVRKQIKELEDQ
jgi:hypothetical protein